MLMAAMPESIVKKDAPEFRIIVKRPNRRGPIAPYRMALTVLFVFFVAGRQLWAAAMTGYGSDGALIDAGVAGLFIWVLSGIVNAILSQGRPA
jgi:hypothetical protein